MTVARSRPKPVWSGRNLTKHRDKHRQCFEDILSIKGRPITETEYAGRIQTAIDQSWLEYEAEKHVAVGQYDPPRAVYVDTDLIVAVTDVARVNMITGFHEHFDKPHGFVPGTNAPIGDRKLKYRKHLHWDEQSRIIKNLRVINDV